MNMIFYDRIDDSPVHTAKQRKVSQVAKQTPDFIP
jgi:hypothetical protein